MAATSIEWTEVTWNPVTGCDRISPGCDNCYALALARRLKAMGQPRYQADGDPRTSGPGFAVTCHEDVLDQPTRWRTPRIVFVNSMSDLAHARVSRSFIAAAWAVMALTRRHTYQVLTKRPKRLAALLADPGFRLEVAGHATSLITSRPWQRWQLDLGGQRVAGDSGPGHGLTGAHTSGGTAWIPPWPLPNVWAGTTVEDDERAWRADALRRAPAAVRFISAEPLLGPVPSLRLDGIDWCIIGGESGPAARPLDLAWVRDLIGRCRGTGTAVFVKQLGTVWARTHGGGKGTSWNAWPPDLRARDYPPGATEPTAAERRGLAGRPASRRTPRADLVAGGDV